MPASWTKCFPFALGKSMVRVCPSQIICQHSLRSPDGKPSSVAKTLTVPIGNRPSAAAVPARPLTTSLIVPSPPAATIRLNPSRAAFRASNSASPIRDVARSVAPRATFSTRDRQWPARSLRAAGFRITTVSCSNDLLTNDLLHE